MAGFGGKALEVTRCEGLHIEDFDFHKVRIGVHLVFEATTSIFENVTGDQCVQALVLTGNAGGNLFLKWKSVYNGIKGADTRVGDIGGGGSNTFILSDWDESGSNRALISSDWNCVYRQYFRAEHDGNGGRQLKHLRDAASTGKAPYRSGK